MPPRASVTPPAALQPLFDVQGDALDAFKSLLSSGAVPSDIAADPDRVSASFVADPASRGAAWPVFVASGRAVAPGVVSATCSRPLLDVRLLLPKEPGCEVWVECRGVAAREQGCYEFLARYCSIAQGEARLRRIEGGAKFLASFHAEISAGHKPSVSTTTPCERASR
jgi:hypothetical protein